jgi:hypothetical protein
MALTKVTGDFIKDGVLTQAHLHTSHGITTAHIGEGSNLYFTNARVDSRIGSLSTSNLSEGTNLYYTQARFNSAFTAKSTSDLSEGTNLYYTDARADARVALIVDSAPGTLNTLNELAAALGDDANFSTTVTNSIATKLPLAGGNMTGAINFDQTNSSGGGDFDFIIMGYNGSWSNNQNGLASIAVNDGTGIVGRYGITYGSGGGRFVVTDLYDGGYAASGDILTIAGNGATNLNGSFAATGNVTGANLNISNWDTAYGWGDHSGAGYATSATTLSGYGITDAIQKGAQIASSAHWNTATRFGSTGDLSQAAGNHALSVRSENNNDAFMSFHIGSDYAVHFGLDGASNRMHVGGWSDGTGTQYQLYDSRDFSVASVLNSNVTLASLGYTGATNANYITNNNQLTNGAGYLTSLPSHTHDDRYYTESEIQQFFDRGYLSNHSATSLAAGWYTIATNTGDRALGEFQIWDTASSDHQSVLFSASHHFGMDTSNDITVLANSRYSGTNFRYIRIKEGGTYDGAALQVYIDGASNTVYAAIVGGNAQESGWVLKDWIADGTDPGDLTSYSSMTERTIVDLDNIVNGGIMTTGPIYSGGQTAQYRVLNTSDEGSGNGLDADTLDGQHASAFQAAGSYAPAGGSYGTDWYGNSLYHDNWVRNHTNNNGHYWSSTGWHLYPKDDDDFFMRSGSGSCALVMTIGNETARGYVYANSSSQIGFLNNTRSWSLKVDNSGHTYATGSHRAPIFYDSNNTSYYTNPDGTSNIYGLTVNQQITGSINGSANSVAITGYGSSQFTFHQSAGSFAGFSGWHNYYIGNHGNGSNYYNTIIAFPFWGTPRYSRLEGNVSRGPFDFLTNERNHTTGYILQSDASLRAPIFYDSNNTVFYTDPSSTSIIHGLQFSFTQHGSANNIRMGNSSTMNAITSGTNNAAFGVEALGACSTGSRNFAYGYASLYSLSSGGSNIAMGDATGYNVTSGSNNLLFGQNAGRTGYQSPYQSIAGVTSDSNQIHMGNENHTTARIQISWTVNSDARDKTDVNPLDLGLEFVKKLNPVTYRWDKRSDYEDRTPNGTNKLPELTLGFLAQEVEVVEKSFGYDVANKTNLVVDRIVDQDHYGITYEKMVPVLTKAIQEQQAIIDDLKSRLETLENN